MAHSPKPKPGTHEQLFSVLFFLMLLMLGLTSAVSLSEVTDPVRV